MNELINIAIAAGAKIYGSISGGKDGQAMVNSLISSGYQIEGLVHADLGRVEWPQSMEMCERIAAKINRPLHVVVRTDKMDMLDRWQHRMRQLMGSDKPFWSSKKNRYCTSDLKRDVINKFFNNCGHDLIISCEGIRAQESTDREKKQPLEIRKRITSKYYDGMTVEEAIAAYKPGKRLALTWYPIFNYSVADVWATEQMTSEHLSLARMIYKRDGILADWWPFHPAYVFGNERVSCMFCIMGCIGDLETAAKHNPWLLDQMIAMEQESGNTFKTDWSLSSLKIIS